ncbi:MAG TPA: response regulator [Herpetosiphonaceae bacterium]
MPQLLVVDDSPTIRRMVMAALKVIPGVHFREASSGLDAIEQMALATIDLMVLDLNMPDMHGLEVIRFLRSHPTYAQLPILVLTTRGDEPMRREVMQAGGSYYLTKPFLPPELAAAVQSLLVNGEPPSGHQPAAGKK